LGGDSEQEKPEVDEQGRDDDGDYRKRIGPLVEGGKLCGPREDNGVEQQVLDERQAHLACHHTAE
jgi:hypothetical protein